MRPGHPVNVGVAVYSGLWASGHHVAFTVDEGSEGLDLNGDGALDDHVLQLYDARSRTLTNVGLPPADGPVPIFGEDFLAFRVYEYDLGGEDVDGDGLLYSGVVQVFDIRTGTVTNLCVVTSSPLLTAERSLVFQDGPVGHTMVFDVDSGLLRDLGLPGSGPIVAGNHVLFSAYESLAGEDVNGDGDQDDRIVHVYDVTTGELENRGISFSVVVAEGDWVGVTLGEAADGVDRNGDGDTGDAIVALYNVTTGRLLEAGLASHFTSYGREIQLNGGRLWVTVPEAWQGHQDLNGDGDALDEVLFAYDLDAKTVVNIGAAVPGGFEAYGDLAAFYQSIGGLGHLLIYDLRARESRDLGRSAGLFLVGHGYVGFSRADLSSGASHPPYVFSVYDMARDRVIDLGLETFFWTLSGDWIDIPVSEYPGSGDLDGDGVLESKVHVLYHVPSGRLVNTATPSVYHSVLTPEVFAFQADEARAQEDFNGDGDRRDGVLQIVTLQPRRREPSWPGYR